MTREFIESVFARIPREVETAIFCLRDDDCCVARICVSLGQRDVREDFGVVHVWPVRRAVAYDDEVVWGFDKIVEEAVSKLRIAEPCATSKGDG